MQAADHAADDEQRERDQHAARAAARRVERAGAAAVRKLHADAEHERADDERRPDRRDRAAEAGHERGDRHDDERGDRDQQQRAEQAAGLALHQEAAPRGGERELGLEEGDAEREAEHDQRGRGRLPVERDQRDQHGGAEHGGDQERPVEPRQAGGRSFKRRGSSCGCRQANGDYEPKPSVFFRSSHLVRAEASGRLASEVQSTIEP